MNFLKTFLAALLAIVVANAVIFIFVVMIFAGVMAVVGTGSSTRVVATGPNSVLRMDFTNGVTDSPDNSPFHSAGLLGRGINLNHTNSLLQVLGAIDNASYDDNIEGIYINVTGGGISLANIEEVRAALQKFRDDTGKFVIAYSEVYSQVGYYFASVADRVFIHPGGAVNWQGLASQVMFYKGTLEKLGVEVEILRHGSFKSAVEPFMLDRMSSENRLQLNTMLESIWGMMLEDISVSRNISPQVLSQYATDLALTDAEAALHCGFVDAILYPDQVEELLSRLATSNWASIDHELAQVEQREADATGVAVTDIDIYSEEGQQNEETFVEDVVEGVVWDAIANSGYGNSVVIPTMIDLGDYIAVTGQSGAWHRSDKIAIVYIDGDIVDGVDVGGSVGGASVAEKLSRVRNDDTVEGVVVRVNSPGGSALASDVIWREMELLRREKPLVVSMGGYAASGGYWVSSPADLILADRSTLTGSIGVFGLLPNAGQALEDILGVTMDVAKTNEHADMGSLFRPLDGTERNYLQNNVEKVYKTFLEHVAAGRNLTERRVDEIGGGRVWTGVDALEIGLVDGIGGLTEAVELCADRAGIAGAYTIMEVVDQPDAVSSLLRALSSSARADAALYGELGDAFAQYRQLRNIIGQACVQARMPYEIEIR